MPLHPKGVLGLKPGAGGAQAVYFDGGNGGVRGLCVRVSPSLQRTYYYRYERAGRRHWILIGDVSEDDASLASARDKASSLRTRVLKARRGQGTFPHEDAKRAVRAQTDGALEITFERVALAWVDSDQFRALRERTRYEYGRVVRRLLIPAFGKMDPNSLAREHVAAFLFDIRDGFDVRKDTKEKDRRKPRFPLWALEYREKSGVMANRVRAHLGSLYRWLTAENQRKLYGVTSNPILGLERIFAEPEPEPHVYSPDELRRIFTAAAVVDELRHLIPLIAYTMTRSNEARGAKWTEINLETNEWKIPGERSKDRREHVVPLSKGALRVLWALRGEQHVVNINNAGFLFPAETKAGYMDQPQDSIKAVRDASKVDDFDLHPLRDTAAHWLIEKLEVPGDVVEDLLSHTPPRLVRAYRGGRRSSLKAMHAAMTKWSTQLDEMRGVSTHRRARRAKAAATAE